MFRSLAPALVGLALMTGCSHDSTSADETASSEGAVATRGPRDNVSGLRFGEYKNRETPSAGQFVTLKLSDRISGMKRKFNGSYSGVFKSASGENPVSGNFQIVHKRVQQPSQASGWMRAAVVKFFAADGATILHEARYQYVQNTAYLTTVDAAHTMELDLVTDAAGKTPYSADCTLTKLHDDNVFEESLSEDEYPDLWIDEERGGFDITIGSSSFDSTPGGEDPITVVSRSGADIDLKVDVGEGAFYRVAVSNKKAVVEFNDGSLRKVAEFRCE